MAENRVFYWAPASPSSWRVQIILEEKKLPYEAKKVNFLEGEHKGPEIMAINPRGQVPSFKDGDAVVNESVAAVLYLESQYSEPQLLPSEPAVKAKVLQRVMEVEVLNNKVAKFALPKRLNIEDAYEEQHIKGIKEELELWNGYLETQKYAATDSFTIADVVFAPWVLGFVNFGAKFEDYPNVKKYYEMIKEYPSVAKASESHSTDMGMPHILEIF